jgi:hypothetical protein
VATWSLKPGLWRISSNSMDIRSCEADGDNDDNSRCIGGTIGSHGNPDDLCMEGHAGPMCMLCVPANRSRNEVYFDRGQGRCKDCPTDAWARAGAVVGGCSGLIALIYFVYLWIKSGHSRRLVWCHLPSVLQNVLHRQTLVHASVVFRRVGHASVPVRVRSPTTNPSRERSADSRPPVSLHC